MQRSPKVCRKPVPSKSAGRFAKVASLVTLFKERLHIEPVCTPGKTGQFDVIADGEGLPGLGELVHAELWRRF